MLTFDKSVYYIVPLVLVFLSFLYGLNMIFVLTSFHIKLGYGLLLYYFKFFE